jgi:Ca2+-binding RTX toxin-like protein
MQVNVDLAGTLGGGSGDGLADSVQVNGTAGPDIFNVSAEAGFVVVDLAADVRVKGYEVGDQVVITGVGGDVVNVNGSAPADTMTVIANGTQARVDATGYSLGLGVSGALSLVIRGLGGPDTISCTGNLAGLLIPITLDGGEDADTLLGSNGADVLIGGEGDDFVDGNQGSDFALLGNGDDLYQWDPGDGNDILEGQADHDTLAFNGSSANEIYSVSSSGQRLEFTRNIGNIVMDVDGIEQLDLQALGGADALTVHDLAGTALLQLNVDLAGTLGGGSGDAQPDAITVNGSAAPDTIHVAANSGAVEVFGLAADVRIEQPEPASDVLTVNGLEGNDTITADPGVSALIQLIVNP